MAITNDEALVRALKEPLKQAVDYVVQKIWNENREQIEQIIYRANTPQDYQRTEEFKNAWETESKIRDGSSKNIVEGTFEYNPSKITTIDAPYHAAVADSKRGLFSAGDSAAEYLAEIIYQGIAGPAFGDGYWRKKRDAFEALLKYIGKQRMNQWFEEGMAHAGLDYKRHGAALQVDYE